LSTLQRCPIRYQGSWLVARLLLGLALVAGVVSTTMPARAQVAGNTYTSPNYGCVYSWDGNWFVAEESSEPTYDAVTITNGITFLTLICEEFDYASVDVVVALMSGSWRVDPELTNFEPIQDAAGAEIRGGEPGRAFAAYSYTYTSSEDGFTRDFGVYFEARLLNAGKTLSTLAADTPIEYFLTEYQLPGVTLPEVSAEPGNSIAIGEPAPVFADGFWRIGIAAAARGSALPGIGLEEKTDKEWIVAIADITNWSDADQTFAARSVRLSLDGVKKPIRVAPASTVTVGERLAFPQLTRDVKISIQPGATIRLALVYSVDAGSAGPVLTMGDARLPLADLLDLQISGDSLPAPAQAPSPAPGTIASASDGRTMRVQIEGETDARRVRLLGVEPPAEDACMEHAAEELLDDLAGQRVMVEEDSAVAGDNSLRYVWLVNADGSRSLLNQRLIGEGRAAVAPIPGDARFGLWLEATEQEAEAGKVGLWAGCDEATSAPAATASGAVSPTPGAAAPTATNEATAPSGATVAWSGEIDEVGTISLTIEGDALTQVSISYEFTCSVAGGTRSGTGRSNLEQPVEMANGAFTIEVGIGPSQAIGLTGLVLSDSSIVGTAAIPAIDGCTTDESQEQWSASPT
jgi:endonuclease YncB( thermonuclease family)